MTDYKGSITAKITASIIWVLILFGATITTYSLIEFEDNLSGTYRKDAEHLTLLIEREAASENDPALLLQRIRNILPANFRFAALELSFDGTEPLVIRSPEYSASEHLIAMDDRQVTFADANGEQRSLVATYFHPPFFQVVNERRTAIIVTFGIPLLLIAALLFFITHRVVTRPLLKVVSIVQKVSGGDMSQRVDFQRNDELGTLADFFNNMLDDLSAKQESLRAEIIQREKAQRSLTLQSQDLKQANHELKTFSYTVSHDLRAPLRAIQGFSSALRDGYETQLDENAKLLLQRICLSVNRMDHLINDVLDLSRVSRQKIVFRTVDLSAMAHEICEDLQENDSARQVDINIHPGLNATADPAMMHIMLSNLLGNAWKYTSKTTNPTIEMGLGSADDDKLVFYVKDNGAGFDMKYEDKLFSPFERLHNNSEYEGTGIGLATVQRVVERHQGEIWARSSPGEGAGFYISLPLVTVQN